MYGEGGGCGRMGNAFEFYSRSLELKKQLLRIKHKCNRDLKILLTQFSIRRTDNQETGLEGRNIFEICTLLGCCALTGVSGQHIGPISRVQKILEFLDFLTFEDGCPQTSISTLHHILRNITEERRSHLLLDGSLYSSKKFFGVFRSKKCVSLLTL
jgi:hypothetical protein